MQKKSRSEVGKFLINILFIFITSSALTVISLAFASSTIREDLFSSYFNSPLLLFMNFMPIFVLMTLIWLLSNRFWLAYGLTSLLVVSGGLANKTKLTYRDDPVVFEDLGLLSEAGMMAQEYKIPFSTRIIVMALGIILMIFIFKRFLNFRLESSRFRLLTFILVLALTTFGFKNYYLREDIYVKLGDMEVINRWLATERFQSKGFVYPFIYSVKDVLEDNLEGYDKDQAIKDLESYSYKDIDEDKKVHVISIMLEAYNDFSQFEGVNIDEEVYRPFHELQEKSVSGDIVTNIFAGGTIDTERAFLTGYQNQPKYRRDTNSFVWYLKEQGYKTEAMHPITGSFYNRRNVNEYLGFDNFDYLENKYEGLAEDYLRDDEFFDFIIKGYEESRDKDRPYFNFSVTYQNHGPYAKVKYHEEDFFERKDEYDEELYNIFNNYLKGIKDTGLAIEGLIDYFEKEDEPVVVVLFGDHNPWLGEGNSVYEMLGINLDLGEEEGFRNYYQTPYLMWANDKAKEVTGNKMVERTEEFGSNYLMQECFDQLGWEGNEYMQYIRDMRKVLPVQHREFYKEDGEYRKELSGPMKEVWERYRNVEHYYARNYRYKNK